jgi:hypothetical protein
MVPHGPDVGERVLTAILQRLGRRADEIVDGVVVEVVAREPHPEGEAGAA